MIIKYDGSDVHYVRDSMTDDQKIQYDLHNCCVKWIEPSIYRAIQKSQYLQEELLSISHVVHSLSSDFTHRIKRHLERKEVSE